MGAPVQAPDASDSRRRRRCTGCSIAAERASGRSRASGTRSQPTFGYSLRAGRRGERRVPRGAGPHQKSTTGSSTGYLAVARAELAQRRAVHQRRGEAPLAQRHEPGRGREDQAAVAQLHGAELRLRARARDGLAHPRPDDAELRVHRASDLLPGFDFGVDYSLFEGSTLSDTARFKPYRERVTVAVSVQRSRTIRSRCSRAIFGKAVPPTRGGHRPGASRRPDDEYAREIASQPVAGRASRTAAYPAVGHAGLGGGVHLHGGAAASARRQSVERRRVRSGDALRPVQHAGAARARTTTASRAPADESVARGARSRRDSPARRSTSRRPRRRSAAA